jgi:general secretion pathway protein E
MAFLLGWDLMSAHYTFDYLLRILLELAEVVHERLEDLASKQSAQRFTLEKERGLTGGVRRLEYVSPAEVLASFKVTGANGPLTEDRIMELVAKAEGLPYVKIDPLKLDAGLVTTTLSRPFARKHNLLPLDRVDGTLRLATDDPFNHDAFDSVAALIGDPFQIVVASKTDITRHLREIHGFRRTLAAAAANLESPNDLGNLEQLVKLKSLDEIETNDQHITNAVEYLLHYAFDQRASDIHIEPKREQATVRLRIDGVLHSVQKIPMIVHRAMVSRIKTLARLDIAEKRRPQDGRIKTRHLETEIELRVSTLPVAFGEKMVIRIFDPNILMQDFESVGFSPNDLQQCLSFLARPHGLILVTGPTGSGKTTTLYSALQLLATDRVNVTTIEDPIEMVLEEFNQTAIMPKIDITFASSLRTILRQDPDVIMVGEIRDRETANQAVQAALTGHLVLSTLHTNDAGGALTRMLELGVEPFLIASTVVGVIAQRLVRKICEACKVPSTLSQDQLLALGLPLTESSDTPYLPVSRGKGCVACRHIGLKGRTGIFEILPMTEKLRKLVVAKSTSPQLTKVARKDGMTTLRESAIKKLAQGITSFEEVLRVTTE